MQIEERKKKLGKEIEKGDDLERKMYILSVVRERKGYVICVGRSRFG